MKLSHLKYSYFILFFFLKQLQLEHTERTLSGMSANPSQTQVAVDLTIPMQRKWLTAADETHSVSTTRAMAGATIRATTMQRATDQQPEGHKSIDKDHFTIVSYNILADHFTPDHFFEYCPREYFKDFQRFPQLMRELDHHDADILCLQEVRMF